MASEPEPASSRRIPPGLRTALATGDDRPVRVALLLSVPVEAHCLAVAFRKLDFVVEIARDMDEMCESALHVRTAIAIVDSLWAVDMLRIGTAGARMQRLFVILVSNKDESADVDYVLVRPLNRDDPLGIGQA